MKNVRVLEAIKDGPKTIEEIAEATGIKPMEVRRYLLRFVEQGKVESYQKEGKLYWKLREKDELEEEFKYV
ncbi:ArsR family transcriptional regulator [Thermococcus sp. M36]|uniref:helix-turn-helix domain-containing protein n=1 Tax=Thermococcus sp. M36 TaxID=1638261 RepID=UPI00143B11B6|nr:helix-turn-helix domain-containing protein [Thermococcus sp. M36]NJE06370.1 ArsR family transcriptional regulator [Thermococcus sp. M36]